MALAGPLVPQDHWKDSTSIKRETLSHSANRISLTALEATATLVVWEDVWDLLSGDAGILFNSPQFDILKF